MVGFIASGLVGTASYVQALRYQAEHGVHAPHRDGWGFCVYTDDGCSFQKSAKAAFEDEYTGPSAALTALFHARQASSHAHTVDSAAIPWEDAHPFVFQRGDHVWSFVHNGTVRDLPEAWGDGTDSQVYAHLLETAMVQGCSPIEAVRSVVRTIREQAHADSLNALLATDDELIAVRCSDLGHTLFYHNSSALFEVSTEPLALAWNEVSIGTMLDVRRDADGLSLQTILL